MAVASAGPSASLHIADRQITTPAPHHSVFTVSMPFLLPNQQHQSIEGTDDSYLNDYYINISKECHKSEKNVLYKFAVLSFKAKST